ncbi:MAG: hypothetical protein ACYC3X_09330 [Pirellulaceae bacterium]
MVPVAWGGILDGLTLPTGLKYGDPFRVVFVTSQPTTATSANINDYNTFVQTAAAGLEKKYGTQNVTWTAIASTPTVDAVTQFGTNSGPLYLLNGTFVSSGLTNNSNGFGSLSHSINLSETGSTIGVEVWTGTDLDGTSTLFPLGYKDPTFGFGISTCGKSDVANGYWIYLATNNNVPTTLRSLYGVSNVLTAVPEPGCLTLWALGAVAFGGVFFVRRRAASRATV